MTEKRFTIKPQDDYFGVTDNYSGDKVNVVNGISTEIEAEWLCELLNELNDENEQLKQDFKIIVEHRKQETEYTARLEEKNEQLRLNNGRLLSDYTDVCNENVALEKKNEQLRKELENNIASYKKCNRRVFDLIDKKIKEVDTIGTEVLKDLRRELMMND